MKRKIKSKTKTRRKKQNIWEILSFLVFIFLVLISVPTLVLLKNSNTTASKIASNAKDSLQIETFKFPTPTPKPTVTAPTPTTPAPYVPPPSVDNGTCTPDAWITDGCTCTGNRQLWVYCDDTEPPTPPQPARGCITLPSMPGYCENFARNHPECRQWCELKPIIYLYPEKETLVDVSIETPGKIYVSDPTYPKNGWKNILSYPSGKLIYQGEQYGELFYEIDHKEIEVPKTGIVIKTENVRAEIKNILLKYGLNDYESGEFLKFWTPKLVSLNKPYILFSIFSKESKDKMDKIILSPQADTRIEVIAYFKGLNTNVSVPIMDIPKNPPIRRGFVMVAWGGLLDN